MLKAYELVGFMEEAGGYFFGHGARRSKPGLDSPADSKRLDCAKDGVGMHAAEFVTPQDLRDRAFDNHSRKIKFTQAFTRPHKGLSGVIGRTAIKKILQRFPLDRHPVFHSGDRIISFSQFFSFYRGKPFVEMLEGIGLLLHAIDDEGWV